MSDPRLIEALDRCDRLACSLDLHARRIAALEADLARVTRERDEAREQARLATLAHGQERARADTAVTSARVWGERWKSALHETDAAAAKTEAAEAEMRAARIERDAARAEVKRLNEFRRWVFEWADDEDISLNPHEDAVLLDALEKERPFLQGGTDEDAD